MTSDSSAPAPGQSGSQGGGAKQGRAGRNLPASIAVGVTLVAVVVVSLAFVKDLFVVVVAAALVVALFELAQALRTAAIAVPTIPVAVGGVTMLVVAYYGSMNTATAVLAITVLATLGFRLRDGAQDFVRDATAGVFALCYLFLMGSFVMRMLTEHDGPWRIGAFIGATIASDIGGYVAGVLFGKHPMSPTISPKKSWEGFAGSLLTGIVVSICTVTLGLHGHWWAGALLGAVAVPVATFGDLFESLIKRDIGIKDMGKILPGHGGIMDRLDSLIAVAPVSYLLLYLLVPVH